MDKPIVKLLHNPKAGETDHSKEWLTGLIESKGYKYYYSSVKKEHWDKIEPDVDMLVIAGGDGTVRKVVSKLLRRRVFHARYPIAILPLGTANNIAHALNIHKDMEANIDSWQDSELKKYDIGCIDGLNKSFFFMESLGFGVFPALIDKMSETGGNDLPGTDNRIRTALENLLRITEEYKAKDCKLTIDGKDYSDKYLLVEFMNTGQVGPNLNLNPSANTGDGLFDIVLVRETERILLYKYVEDKLNGIERPLGLETLQARKAHISWHGSDIHVDEDVINSGKPMDIHMRAGILEFMVPKQEQIEGATEAFV